MDLFSFARAGFDVIPKAAIAERLGPPTHLAEFALDNLGALLLKRNLCGY
jgi:hypothetical protein